MSIWARMVILIMLAGCGAGPQRAAPVPPGPQVIDTDLAFRAQLAGRDLLGAPGEVLRASGDGSWLLRRDNHIAASGVWNWEDGLWCRVGQAAGQPLSRKCHTLLREGAVLRMSAATPDQTAGPREGGGRADVETWRIAY